jgi:hypothetical protein
VGVRKPYLACLVALVLLPLQGCAGTTIDLPGFGTYRSSKDIEGTELHLERSQAPDGTVTLKIDAGAIRGDASPVIAAQTALFQAAFDAALRAAMRAPGGGG